MRPRTAAWMACVTLTLAASLPATAQTPAVDLQQVQIDWTESGIFLSGSLKFELSATVEDALHKGIPMYFVAEAELYRDRWYWTDRRIGYEARHLRLAYQPLTRRWRLNVSPTAISNSGLGVTLNQNFDALPDALASVQRFSRWKISDIPENDSDNKYHVEFNFRLDVSQLPRPFQIGAVGQPDWSLALTRSLRLPAEGNGK